jgi:hypothetical protein
MLTTQELADRLIAVAIGTIGISEFEEWFVAHSWGASNWGTPEMRTAVYTLELALAEYSNKHVDSSQVRVLSAELADGIRNREILPSPVGSRISNRDITRGRVHAARVQAAA